MPITLHGRANAAREIERWPAGRPSRPPPPPPPESNEIESAAAAEGPTLFRKVPPIAAAAEMQGV